MKIFWSTLVVICGLSLLQPQALVTAATIQKEVDRWVPLQTDALYIQLQNEITVPAWASVVDVDLFNVTAAQIRNWQADGKKVVCYFSAGSYEDWRSDAKLFPKQSIGNELDSWAGESWLDVRSDVVKLIMQIRILTAVVKGCDGIDPDNVDGYSNDTGYPLTFRDSVSYNLLLAKEAHRFGLAIGLKNSMDMLPNLAQAFDFAINEQCNEYDECDTYKDFTKLGKPVFNLEYQTKYKNNVNQSFDTLCVAANKLNIKSYIYPLSLDGTFVSTCR